MGLTIRNLNNKFLEIKIKQCIGFLENEYKALNYTITFYEKRGDLTKERKENPNLKEENYEQILSGKTEAAGVTIGDKKEIKIFLFLFNDLKKDPNGVTELIGNLYHEIRHAWQVENNMFQDEEEISKIDGNLEAYLKLPSEIDAYKFQDKQMKKLAPRVLKIFGHQKGIIYELKPEIRDAIYP